MPTVVRLGNIKIVVYAADPPHFHLLSAEYAAIVSIETLEITSGYVPRHAYEVATRWAFDHMDLLLETWTRLNG